MGVVIRLAGPGAASLVCRKPWGCGRAGDGISADTASVKHSLRLADAAIAGAGSSFARSLDRGIRAGCSCALNRQLERIELGVLGAVSAFGWTLLL